MVSMDVDQGRPSCCKACKSSYDLGKKEEERWKPLVISSGQMEQKLNFLSMVYTVKYGCGSIILRGYFFENLVVGIK